MSSAFAISREIAAALRDVAHRYCVAIFALQDGRPPAQCATGTLFQVADRHFLISAAHVVTDVIAGKARLGLHNGLAKSSLIPLEAAPFSTVIDAKRSGDTHGPFDLAIWPLEDTLSEELRRGKEFANQSCVTCFSDMSQLPANELFYLCGFPTRMADTDDRDIMLTPVRWIARRHANDVLLPPTCDRRFHILLNKKTAIAIGPDDGPADPPKVPEGISGCGIWAVGWERLQRGTWRPTDPQLVAVQTRVYTDASIIRGTGWTGVRSILVDEYPELKPSLMSLDV